MSRVFISFISEGGPACLSEARSNKNRPRGSGDSIVAPLGKSSLEIWLSMGRFWTVKTRGVRSAAGSKKCTDGHIYADQGDLEEHRNLPKVYPYFCATLSAQLLAGKLLPNHKEWRCEEDRRVCTSDHTDDECEREVVRRSRTIHV